MTDLTKEQKIELLGKSEKDMSDEEFETASDMQATGEADKLLKDTKSDKDETPDDNDDSDKAPDEEHIDDDDDDSKKKPKPDKKDKDEGDEDDKGKEGEDDDDDDKGDKSKHHKISLSKHQRKVKKMEEAHKQTISDLTKQFEGKIDDLQSEVVKISAAKSKAETKKALKKLAKDSGVDYKVLQGVVDITRKELSIDTSKMNEIHKSQENALESSKFEEDFTDTILEKLNDVNTDISSSQLKKAKARVKELAYSDKYVNYSLEDVYKLHKTEIDKLIAQVKKNKSGEPSRPNSQRGQDLNAKPITKMNAEEIADLSDEEFAKMSDEAAKGQKRNQVMREGEIIN